jgi:hypothetical protein
MAAGIGSLGCGFCAKLIVGNSRELHPRPGLGTGRSGCPPCCVLGVGARRKSLAWLEAGSLCEDAHGPEDSSGFFIGGYACETGCARHLDIDGHPVRPSGCLEYELRGGSRNDFEMDVASKALALPEGAGHVDKALHRGVGTPEDARGEKSTLYVVAAIKLNNEADEFLGLEGGAVGITGAAIGAVGTIVRADIGEENFEKGDTAAIGRP